MPPSRREGGYMELLSAILRDLPDRHGALCIGRHDLFDAVAAGDLDALRVAEWLCRRCPHAADCPDSLTSRDAVRSRPA